MRGTYYEYWHKGGYGRDDHMAGEIIARAARNLDLAGAGSYILQAVGFASHSVPLGNPEVRLRAGKGVKAKMQRALREAYREVQSNDTHVYVACVRYGVMSEDGRRFRVVDERRGTKWYPISQDEIEEEDEQHAEVSQER